MDIDIHPDSIAIAGSWGYIGRKFLDAALALNIRTAVFDPGPTPDDVDPRCFTSFQDAQQFYAQKADLFHLALHPEHRRTGLELLLPCSQKEQFLILNEKPMATPGAPEQCDRIVQDVAAAGALMLYDFPELFDEMTERICSWLASFRQVRIDRIFLRRSKDREAKENPRNYKRMVPIEYQESVHCLAYLLYVLGRLEGDVRRLLDRGVSVKASAQPYCPPNPEMYPQPVDGCCDYSLQMGDVAISGVTNFKAGASWSKQRIIEGTADGQRFQIDVNYLEGKKTLAIDDVDQACDPTACSYQQTITRSWQWSTAVARAELMTGVYPNPQFARLTYQLSSMLWRSAQDQTTVTADSHDALLGFDAKFR